MVERDGLVWYLDSTLATGPIEKNRRL
jgi:hypothetical protein